MSPQSDQTVPASSPAPNSDNAGVVKYTVTGLTDGTPVDIHLADPSNITTGADGQTTFTATSGNADWGSPAGSITVVNGVVNASGDHAYGVMPVNGQITFSVNSTSSGSAAPVVYSQADTNDSLEVDANGAPTEDFGVGGTVTWSPAQAAQFSSASGVVDRVDGQTLWIDTTSPADGVPDVSAQYVSGDSFLYTSGGANSPISMSQFSNWISKGDTVGYTSYNPGNTAWNLKNDVPNAPTGVAASYDSKANDVVVSFTPPTNPDVVSYKLLQASVTNGKVGTYSDTGATASNNKFTIAAPGTGTYSYEVEAVNKAGNPSPASDASQVNIPAAADTTAPTVQSIAVSDANKDGQIDNGDQVAVTFSEAVTLGNQASFTFRDNDGSVASLSRGGNATMSLNSAGTTAFINVTGAPVPEQPGTTLGLDSTAANETVTNSSGVTDLAGNDLAEVQVTPGAVTAGASTVTFTANAPVDGTTVSASDFTTTSAASVQSATVSGNTITVTMSAPFVAGDTVTLKAESIANTDGGNGPASAVTAK